MSLALVALKKMCSSGLSRKALILIAGLLWILTEGFRPVLAQGDFGFPGAVVVPLDSATVSVSGLPGLPEASRYLAAGTRSGFLNLTKFRSEVGTVGILDRYFLGGVPVALESYPGPAGSAHLVAALTGPDRLVFMDVQPFAPYFTEVQTLDLEEDPGDIGVVNFPGGTAVGLAVCLPGMDRILILGKQEQGWSVQQDLPTGDRPIALAVGDLDGDGLDEIYVSQQGFLSENIGVFHQNQQAEFSRDEAFVPGFLPGPLAVFDLEGDGAPELILGSGDQPVAAVLEYVGGGLRERELVSLSLPTTSLHPVRMVDGSVALICANTGRGLVEFSNFRDGTWTLQPPYYPGCSPVDCLPQDLNGDGLWDLVSVGDVDGFTIMYGDGSPGFWGYPALPLSGDPLGVDVADVDGNGTSDVVVIHRLSATVSIFDGLPASRLDAVARNENLSFSPGLVVPFKRTDTSVMPLAFSDPATNRIVILDLSRPGLVQTLGTVDVGTPPARLKAADVDADGNDDLLVLLGNVGQARILFGDGQGNFPVEVSVEGSGFPKDLALLDLNGDGYLDLALSDGYSQVVYRLNQGGRSFGPSRGVEAGTGVAQLACGDLDGDKDRDLVAVNDGDQSLTLLENDGHGNLVPRLGNYGLSSAPAGIEMGDVDGDGRSEILVNLRQAGKMAVVLVAGPWEYAVTLPFNVGARNIAVFTDGDFNVDGKSDILALDASLQLGLVMLNEIHTLVAVDPGALEFTCADHGAMVAVTPDRSGPWTLAARGSGDWVDLAGPGWSSLGEMTYERGTWFWTAGPDFPEWLPGGDAAGRVSLRLTVGSGPDQEIMTRSWEDPCAKDGPPVFSPNLGWVEKPWPNPFNPNLDLAVKLERPAELSVRVYDLRGRVMAQLFDGRARAGVLSLTWDGRGNGRPAPSGVYLIRAATDSDQLLAKVILAR